MKAKHAGCRTSCRSFCFQSSSLLARLHPMIYSLHPSRSGVSAHFPSSIPFCHFPRRQRCITCCSIGSKEHTGMFFSRGRIQDFEYVGQVVAFAVVGCDEWISSSASPGGSGGAPEKSLAFGRVAFVWRILSRCMHMFKKSFSSVIRCAAAKCVCPHYTLATCFHHCCMQSVRSSWPPG